jgi:drug/metabolite transporter (DMT)-like permease
MGYVAAFLDVLLFAVGIYCFGYAARRSSLLYVLFLQTLFGLILIFPLLLFFDKLDVKQIFLSPKPANWYWLSAAAVFGFLGGNYFSLLNLRTAGEKINSLLSPAITALALVLSYFVFKETLQIYQWIGALITLGIVAWFLLKQKKDNDLKYNSIGFLSGALTIICISLTIIFSIKGASDTVTYFQAIWIRLLIALLIIFIGFIFRAKKIKLVKASPAFYLVVLAGVVCQIVIADYLWFYASFKIGIDTFQIILSTLPLWLYAMDVYVLKKSKPNLLFLLAALIALIGIFLVML